MHDIPKDLRRIDIIYSFNYLGYVDDISKFTKKLKRTLAKKGKYCCHIYHNAINTTPNALIIEDKKNICKLFRDAGLSVRYVKVKRIIFEHIFIYGKKK